MIIHFLSFCFYNFILTRSLDRPGSDSCEAICYHKGSVFTKNDIQPRSVGFSPNIIIYTRVCNWMAPVWGTE